MDLKDEPLLINSSNKYTIFPIEHQKVWDYYLTHLKAIWFTDDVDTSSDLKDWAKLNKDEQYFIKHILAFFAASDGIVMENLAANFCNEIQMAEARQFYSMQMFIESIHSIMYSKLIETYVSDSDEKIDLFNAIEKFPSITKKAVWAKKWMDTSTRFAVRLVGFAIVEGLFFSGAFCSIYWLNERGLMHGLCMSNKYIARDEGLHCDFAIYLYNTYIKNKLSQEEIDSVISEAVAIEKEFIVESLPVSLIGMNSNMMSQYIEYVADRLVKQLGHKSIFDGTKNPFPFMDRICLSNQTNFFDTRVSEYQRTDGQKNLDMNDISFGADF